MKKLPELTQEAVRRYPNSIDDGVAWLLQRVKSQPDYPEFVQQLVEDALRGRIANLRHSCNQETKRANGFKPIPESRKVNIARSKTVVAASQEWLDYFIGGRTLGNLLGSELIPLAVAEEHRAEGYFFNAKLLRKLATVVPEDKKVRAVVSERRVSSFAKSLRKAMKGEIY